ncbi:unnamed protein product [Rotaria sp. Silwood2]|nr:unnamed protein product [Rotaria sp. Silwood2]CAF3887173.1 unnamed protein product [Rotaria sp. Silwood2]CAF4131757.1 unnamed protein product [Rotaria sp. Silwood2]CAF4354499.1 unnamed protein product [Rotaria sp. Silwood2]
MAPVTESNLCAICNKSLARCFCIGCKKYFCPKDFKEHEQQVSMKFDNEIVRSHDELLNQIQKLEKSNCFSSDLFDQIERWKQSTIKKVEKAADRAHHKLIELIDKQRTKLTKQLEPITKEIHCRWEEKKFLENDIDRLRKKIEEIQRKLEQLIQKDTTKTIIIDNNQIDWNRLIYIREEQQNYIVSFDHRVTPLDDPNCVFVSAPLLRNAYLNANAKWVQNGITVAGGKGHGSETHQLKNPWGLCVDDDQTVYIADFYNHRIVEWKCGATTGRVVAGGNGQGNRSDQLNCPTNAIIDKERDSLIICDRGNQRIVRWPRHNGTNGETIISNVGCSCLTMDDDGFIYIADWDEHEVRRYRIGESQGIVVAGRNGQGNRLDQLNHPVNVFVDRYHSVYVSDYSNHRVMKWMKGAKQGIVVAGCQGQRNSLTQLSNPGGVVVDQSGTVYVADGWNHRIMRWSQGTTQGSVIIGENGRGSQSNQLYYPTGLSFDREGNLYVSDQGNHRVQKFNIDRS